MMTLQAELSRFRKATLNSAVKDADKLLDMLVQAREQIANGTFAVPGRNPRHRPQSCAHIPPPRATASDPHRASLTMTKLQNPVNAGFDSINNDLKDVSKAQKVFGKALDKVRLTSPPYMGRTSTNTSYTVIPPATSPDRLRCDGFVSFINKSGSCHAHAARGPV